jgi:hypothetical protein
MVFKSAHHSPNLHIAFRADNTAWQTSTRFAFHHARNAVSGPIQLAR